MNISEKYFWIINHPDLSKWGQAVIELTPHMVNPENNTIEEDEKLNTKLEWWVELNRQDFSEDQFYTFHDYEFDCGGDTAEEAIEALYKIVLEICGNYKSTEGEEL